MEFLRWVLASTTVEQYGPIGGAIGLVSGLVYLIRRQLQSNDELLKPAQEDNRDLRARIRRLERDRQALMEALTNDGKPIPPEVLADDA